MDVLQSSYVHTARRRGAPQSARLFGRDPKIRSIHTPTPVHDICVRLYTPVYMTAYRKALSPRCVRVWAMRRRPHEARASATSRPNPSPKRTYSKPYTNTSPSFRKRNPDTDRARRHFHVSALRFSIRHDPTQTAVALCPHIRTLTRGARTVTDRGSLSGWL